ncbi:MAG: hypothetical protein JNL38_36675 [Myxococcales bacterium]|nr:hypothetical protein [Myxococcales bacterium]
MRWGEGWVVVVGALALVGCNIVSDAGSDAGAAGGEVAPSCYLAKSGKACECYAQNKDGEFSAADYTKVAQCTEAKAGFALTCYVDTKVDGTTSSCSCNRFVPECKITGSGYRGCVCDPDSEGTDGACSGPKYEWCCAANDGTSCYCGNGNSGSACGNEEANVPTCSKATIKRAKGALTSCDGLKFAKK